jgi:heterodisulfide reductase subunit B
LSKPEYREKMNELFGEYLDIPTIHINELIAILRGCEEERCITLRRKTPRIEEIYNIITQQ